MTADTISTAAFKDCDIRGVYPIEVGESLFERVGRVFAAQVDAIGFPNVDAGTVVLGGDARLSTPGLRTAFLAGMMASPIHVVDLGQVPTPVVYWAKARRGAQGSAIVTASHNPPSWNGLKLTNGPLPPTPEDIARLAEMARRVGPGGPPRGVRTEWPFVVRDYLDEMRTVFAGAGIDRMNVVIDPGNGCLAGIASRLCEGLGARVAALHDAVDGLFRQRHPDCAVPEHLSALAAAVTDRRADLGIAFDGDGDRIAVVDGRGRILGAERLAMVLLDGVLGDVAGSSIILDVKCSMHLERKVRALGAEPVRCKSGHAYMKRKALERRSVAGVELSGHIFLGRIEARDDPLYTALLLMSWLSGQSRSLAEMVDELPPMYMTPDIRIGVSEDRITQLLAACADGQEGARVEVLDGVRLVWPDGWIRGLRSITELKVTIRLEGETPEGLKRIGSIFCRRFPELRDPVADSIRRATEPDA